MNRRGLLGLVLVLVLTVSACGDDGGGGGGDAREDANPPAGENESASDDGMEPQQGGTLTHGIYSETAGLDPVVTFGGGATGTSELAAIYDTLMRYDPDSGEFEPHMAESLTPDDDHTVWTLKLRPDVRFTDGTVLDAEAVSAGLQRHTQHQSRAALLVSMISEFNVVDDLTLELVLSSPYPNFPYVLAFTPGMIPSPTAVEEACKVGQPDEITSARDCPFNTEPVGAGPYMLESWQLGESLTLVPNPDYWGGTPHLDELRFVASAPGSVALEALRAGSIQSAYMRDPIEGNEAEEDPSLDTYLNLQWLSNAVVLNNGVVECTDGQPNSVCAEGETGQVELDVPTKDVRIRQAVAAALDHDVLNRRVFDGHGAYSGHLFHEGSRWESSEPLSTYDPARAEELIAEVEAEGDWDGSIRLLCSNTQTDLSLAIEAMLTAAGFDVELDNGSDVRTNLGTIQVQKDFDAACSGFSMSEEAPEVALMLSLNASAPNNFMNHDITAIDEQAEIVVQSPSDEERHEALEAIQDIWREEMPSVLLGATPERLVWSDAVHGIVPNVWTTVLWHDVWIES